MILDEIVANKRHELVEQKRAVPVAELEKGALAQPAPLDLVAALRGDVGEVRLIAEIKKASPSKGPLRPDLDPETLAKLYAENGAAAISVLTERCYFCGSGEDLRAAKAALTDMAGAAAIGEPFLSVADRGASVKPAATFPSVTRSRTLHGRPSAEGPQANIGHLQCYAGVKPAATDGASTLAQDRGRAAVLRKDFIFDPYQVVEARAWGADALLLIAAILADDQLKALLDLTHQLGMRALVETHDAAEVRKTVNAGAAVIGINNRDLRSFSVDLATTEKLRDLIPPDRLVVSESGIGTREDVDRLRQRGIHAVLIGEALVTAGDVGTRIRELLSGNPEALAEPGPRQKPG